jgi:fatty-acyl-CoA synthase
MKHLYDGSTVGDMIVGVIRRYADRVALQSGDERVTYREMGEHIGRWARVFRSHGLGPQAGVGILSKNRAEVMYAQMAAVLCGSRYTPLHPLGSFADHLYACDDANLRVLCVDPSFAMRGEDLRSRAKSVRALLTFGPADAGSDIHALASAVEVSVLSSGPHGPEDTASIMYTGGTTGVPKGVMLPNRAIVANAVNVSAFCDFPGAPRYLVCAPLSHGANMFTLPTLLNGGTLVLQALFDAEDWLRTVEAEQINLVFMVPSMIYSVLDHPRRDHYDLSSLQTLIYGGSPMIEARAREALDAFGPILTQIYGQTESYIATVLLQAEHDTTRAERLQSCGTEVPGVRVALLDDNDHEVIQGHPGEICIQGPTLMSGYLNQPAMTADALRGGWHHTGDVGVRGPDGFLYIVDRKKDMIISGGFNVYPREVEDVLNGHAGVASSAVIGVPDAKWGEAVTAFVVPRAGTALDANQLTALVRDKKGAAYAPKSITIVEALPLTPVGKPDKKTLRQQAISALTPPSELISSYEQ